MGQDDILWLKSLCAKYTSMSLSSWGDHYIMPIWSLKEVLDADLLIASPYNCVVNEIKSVKNIKLNNIQIITIRSRTDSLPWSVFTSRLCHLISSNWHKISTNISIFHQKAFIELLSDKVNGSHDWCVFVIKPQWSRRPTDQLLGYVNGFALRSLRSTRCHLIILLVTIAYYS